MSLRGSVREHYLFRVSLGYFTLVWLLILAIVVVFPLLEFQQDAVTLAIAMLIGGYPIVLLIAWAFGDRTGSGLAPSGKPDIAGVSASARIERTAIAILILTIAAIGIHQFVIEERNDDALPSASSSLELRENLAETPVTNRLQSIRIGIISPQVGSRLPTTGDAHEMSIRLAFERLPTLRIGAMEVRIQLIPMNDMGEPELASELALQLARDHEVAAILGPVNSASTAAVIETLRKENIDIPVISSMSTARNLIEPGNRDPNFFRLIFDDADRMRSLRQFIEDLKRSQGAQRYLFAYEDDEYGRGLVEDLQLDFYTASVETATWCSLVEPAICPDGTLDSSEYHAIEAGEMFTDEFIERLENREFDNVVLLGTVPGSLAIALGTSVVNDRLDYFFVGSNKELFDKAPVGAIAIGNPVLDPLFAPNAQLRSQWSDILSHFQVTYSLDPSNFLVTSYEAGMVLNSALRSILQERDEVPPFEQLRRELLDILELRRFDSLEPWRKIQFDYGQLTEPHSKPIYRFGRGFTREDETEPRAWVQIDVEPRFNYMEGPIRARLVGNSVDSASVTLSRVHNGQITAIRTKDVAFLRNEATVDFHVFRTGLYRISIEDTNYAPLSATTQLVMMPTYLLSVITALIGALIVVAREPASVRTRIVRTGLGVFAGFALTFSALYGSEVASWIPFPTFGDEPYINAAVTGLIGGLLGPYVLAEAFLSWALTLSIGRRNETSAHDIPEGL